MDSLFDQIQRELDPSFNFNWKKLEDINIYSHCQMILEGDIQIVTTRDSNIISELTLYKCQLYTSTILRVFFINV